MRDLLAMHRRIEADDHTQIAKRPGAKHKGKLDEEKARSMRERAADRENYISMKALGEEYGVSAMAVRDVLYGKSWTDAGGPIIPKGEKYRPAMKDISGSGRAQRAIRSHDYLGI